MVTIGQTLTAPEAGWKRYDDNNSLISYHNGIVSTYGSPYGGNYTTLNSIDSKAVFYFVGTKIRIISTMFNNWNTNIGIKIDEVEETFSERITSTTYINQALVYEKTGLSNGKHKVEIFRRDTYVNNNQIAIDAIDIDEDGEIVSQDYIFKNKRLILKNPLTNQYYSLTDKTLILLPDGSDETMINYGIEAGKEIRLDEEFDKKIYPSDEGKDLGNGKVFEMPIQITKKVFNTHIREVY